MNLSTPSIAGLAASGLAVSGLALATLPAAALDTPGPVVCTTTLEAPVLVDRAPVGAPVEVTRCGVVRTTSELATDRYYAWRAPYARGVGVVNQITDLFGIAMGGGREGNRVMGFGFPDQAITWDGSSIENTAAFLLDQQSPGLPLRTADLPAVYGGSIADPARTVVCPSPDRAGCAAPLSRTPEGPTSYYQPVRGMW
jgi:hypothetical protein